MTIAIIKYGMGNVASVQKALKKLGYNSVITDNPTEIVEADILLLPGVGSFKKGMENLKKSNLIPLLNTEVIQNKKPFIGICLGMQLVASIGNEPEKVNGLGWIEGEVVKIKTQEKLRIPHLGWNTLLANDKKEFYSEFNNKDVYFIHSYHFEAKNKKEVTLSVNYGSNMIAALQKDNIYAMQFHPEKSQEIGMQLLKKIVAKYA